MSYDAWMKATIEEIALKVFSGGTPSTKNSTFWNGSLAWLSSGETRNNFITDTEKTITQAGVDGSSTRLSEVGDIVIASAGQGFTRGQTALCKIDTYINQSIVAIRCNPKITHNMFVYYNIKNRYNELRAISDGHSIRGSLTTKLIKGLDISLPSIKEQKAIVNILSSLDDKIELNNKINQNLDSLAQTLYKRWFVDFEFPNENGEPYKSSGGEMVDSELGLIPKGWEILNLKDRFAFDRGIEPGSKNYHKVKDFDSIPFYRVGDLNKKSELFVNKTLVKEKIVFENDILVSFDGAIGRIGIGFSGTYSTGLRKVYDKEQQINNSFVYNMMKSSQIQETMASHANGTTILHAGSSIPFLKIVFDDKTVKLFEDKVNPIFDKIIEIIKENQKLSDIRDTLLPKLMNGEIEVPI